MTESPIARRTGRAALIAVSLATGGLLWRGITGRAIGEPAPTLQREARDLHGAAAGLCASVLADSAIEHYRGSFENKAMFAPLMTSALAIGVGLGTATGAALPSAVRRGTYALATAVGASGLGFHLYNVLRQPGGMNWLNLFYAAPLGAPAALGVGGALGLAAERVGQAGATEALRWGRWRMGRALCALVATALAGTVGEAALLHYRGSFQNPFMWLPLSVPPVAAFAAARTAVSPPRRSHRFARAWLRVTAMLGLAGVGFHAYGVSRAMGGWRNWRQNVLDGPPLPAPPSFSALALAGLAALRLRERDDA
jgi:hypothetical protein